MRPADASGLREDGAVWTGEGLRRHAARRIGNADVVDGALGGRVGVVLTGGLAHTAEARLRVVVHVDKDLHLTRGTGRFAQVKVALLAADQRGPGDGSCQVATAQQKGI